MTFPTGPFTDIGVELQSRRIPIESPEAGTYAPTHEVLVNIAQLQTEQLATMQHIRKSLDQPMESRSSCTVKTSTRGHDLEVKSYADGLLANAVDDALRQYARGMRELLTLQANGWEQTVEMVARGMADAN